VVAWNTDKRYLGDLIEAGVPTLPSTFFAPGEKVRVPKGEVVEVVAGGVPSRAQREVVLVAALVADWERRG